MIPAIASALAASAAPAMAAGPGVAASPALHQQARIALGTTKSIFQNIFTEAPDGSVFYSTGSVVHVVTGNSAPKVAVHASGTVIALAANAKDLFVEVGLTVTEYTRAHGSAVRHWTTKSAGKHVTSAGLTSQGNTLWSWTDVATDSSGFEFAWLSRIGITSSAVHIVDKQMYPADVAADSSGLFFQDAQGTANSGFLVHATPSGSLRARKGPVDSPMAIDGSKLYELTFNSNTDHPLLDGFATSTLARVSSAKLGTFFENLASTKAGLLVLADNCKKGISCSSAAVSKIASNGKTSGKLAVPFGFTLVAGPFPAVVEITKGQMFLVRIGS